MGSKLSKSANKANETSSKAKNVNDDGNQAVQESPSKSNQERQPVETNVTIGDVNGKVSGQEISDNVTAAVNNEIPVSTGSEAQSNNVKNSENVSDNCVSATKDTSVKINGSVKLNDDVSIEKPLLNVNEVAPSNGLSSFQMGAADVITKTIDEVKAVKKESEDSINKNVEDSVSSVMNNVESAKEKIEEGISAAKDETENVMGNVQVKIDEISDLAKNALNLNVEAEKPVSKEVVDVNKAESSIEEDKQENLDKSLTENKGEKSLISDNIPGNFKANIDEYKKEAEDFVADNIKDASENVTKTMNDVKGEMSDLGQNAEDFVNEKLAETSDMAENAVKTMKTELGDLKGNVESFTGINLDGNVNASANIIEFGSQKKSNDETTKDDVLLLKNDASEEKNLSEEKIDADNSQVNMESEKSEQIVDEVINDGVNLVHNDLGITGAGEVIESDVKCTTEDKDSELSESDTNQVSIKINEDISIAAEDHQSENSYGNDKNSVDVKSTDMNNFGGKSELDNELKTDGDKDVPMSGEENSEKDVENESVDEKASEIVSRSIAEATNEMEHNEGFEHITSEEIENKMSDPKIVEVRKVLDPTLLPSVHDDVDDHHSISEGNSKTCDELLNKIVDADTVPKVCPKLDMEEKITKFLMDKNLVEDSNEVKRLAKKFIDTLDITDLESSVKNCTSALFEDIKLEENTEDASSDLIAHLLKTSS